MGSSAGDPEGGIQHSSQYSGESGKSAGSRARGADLLPIE